MTMPHLMNCGHSETGHCLDCVKAAWDEKESLRIKYHEILALSTTGYEGESSHDAVIRQMRGNANVTRCTKP